MSTNTTSNKKAPERNAGEQPEPKYKGKAGSGAQDLNLKNIAAFFMAAGRKIAPYTGLLVFVLIAIVYVFVILRINAYSTPTVTESEVSQKIQSAVSPKIDDNIADQLRSLEDNSVNVQTLFEESRQSPFNE